MATKKKERGKRRKAEKMGKQAISSEVSFQDFKDYPGLLGNSDDLRISKYTR